jgi:hypothetical protein
MSHALEVNKWNCCIQTRRINIWCLVVFFLLDDSPASEIYVPTFRNTLFHLHVHTTYENVTECSEISAHKIQTPGSYPKERIQHSQQAKVWNEEYLVRFSAAVRLRKRWLLHLIKRNATKRHILENCSRRKESQNFSKFLPWAPFLIIRGQLDIWGIIWRS